MKTLYEYRTLPEGQTFDRKSARIDSKALAVIMVAMANADGGTIAVGIEDDGTISGIDGMSEHINELLRVPFDYCIPSVNVHPQRIPCIDKNGKDNHILILEVEQSSAMHATSSDEAYYRVGDKSKRLSFDDRMQIMLAKGVQYYEDYPVARATVEDLDLDFVSSYCKRIGYKKDALTFLRTNGDYVVIKDGKEQVSGAAILLFGKDPQRFFQRAYIRFIRYEGTEEKVGREMNVIKDIIFRGKILDMTREAIAFVKTQIKDRTYLGPEARFVTEPEYPEFSWTELIVNAVAHRDYSILGTDIQIKLFDDHYTVESPGILPGRVRLNNMRTTHFSRNPKIAAFMKEYEFIREFGEGVDRMYRELEAGGWPKPIFKQDDFMLKASLSAMGGASNNRLETNSVKLESALKNALKNAPETEAKILLLILDNPTVSLDGMSSAIKVSRRTVANKVKKLQEQTILLRIGAAKGGRWSVDVEALIRFYAK